MRTLTKKECQKEVSKKKKGGVRKLTNPKDIHVDEFVQWIMETENKMGSFHNRPYVWNKVL